MGAVECIASTQGRGVGVGVLALVCTPTPAADVLLLLGESPAVAPLLPPPVSESSWAGGGGHRDDSIVSVVVSVLVLVLLASAPSPSSPPRVLGQLTACSTCGGRKHGRSVVAPDTAEVEAEGDALCGSPLVLLVAMRPPSEFELSSACTRRLSRVGSSPSVCVGE